MYRLLVLSCLTLIATTGHAAEVSSSKYSIIASDKGKVVRFNAEGEAVWEYSGIRQVHTLQQLSNGNILCQKNWQTIVEINPDGEIVWSYDSTTNGNKGRKLEVHAFQRLSNGNTMIIENGIGRIIEVDPLARFNTKLNTRLILCTLTAMFGWRINWTTGTTCWLMKKKAASQNTTTTATLSGTTACRCLA